MSEEQQNHSHHHSEQPTLPLRIFQINKSQTAHLEIINNIESDKWNIILVQEPHMLNKFNTI